MKFEQAVARRIACCAAFVMVGLVGSRHVDACDFCMCSYGVSPVQPTGIRVGFDFRFLMMNSIVDGHNVIDNVDQQRETYSTLRLMGTIPLSENGSLILTLPVSSHRLSTNAPAGEDVEPDASSAGLSDAVALYSYRFWNEMSGAWNFSAAAAGGFKFPTGFTGAKDAAGEYLDPDLQEGTGSFDPMVNLTLLAGTGPWGMNVNLFEWLPTTGARGYRYGNSLTYEANAMYHVFPNALASTNLFLGAGVGGESHGVEYQDSVAQDATGGNSLYIAPMARVVAGRVTINARGQYYFVHAVNGRQLDYTYRIIAGMMYQL